MPVCFAVCTPGLEEILRKEMISIGLSAPGGQNAGSSIPGEPDDEAGGVEFQGSVSDLYNANLRLRTASRVLLRLGSFYADTFSDLKRRTKRLSWESYLRPGQPVALRVSCHKSRLYHSEGVAENIIGGIAASLGSPPAASEDKQDSQMIVVRL
ncbi:MAG TPA: THUMP domain-containing protein, partial [Thermodesulfobacteriota bacterium]|nr:THUMP domain-containing protein [Thermodesulfobacteriota bacterium]